MGPERSCVEARPPRAYGEGIRRITTVGALVACALVLTWTSVAGAATVATPRAHQATATTEATIPGGNPDLPRTDLEQDERDNGHTAQAPYLIWSGIVSAVVVGVGGLLFKRRYDRENKAVLVDVAATRAAKASAAGGGAPVSDPSAN